jgi:hypothetical protein
MNMKLLTSTIVLSFILSFASQAQTDCSQVLVNAERSYYNGQFSDISKLITGCLADGFSKDQKSEGYKLLALGYIFSKKFEQADSALLLMLKINPQFEAGPLDPPELRRRIEKFKVHPQFGFTFSAGPYQPFFHLTQVYNIRNLPSDVSYKGKTGYSVGVSASYYISKNIIVEGGYEWQSFSFKVSNIDTIVEARLEEKQNRQQVWGTVAYGLKVGPVILKLAGGLAYNSLKKAESSLYKLEKETSIVNLPGQLPVTSEATYIYREQLNFSNLSHRTLNDVRGIVKLTASLPQKGKYSIDVFARYEFGTKNFTRNRNSDPIQSIRQEWIEDDFKANYLTVGFSFTKLYYNVRRK